MVSWNNLDTLASYKELFEVEKVDLVAAMTGEGGAERVKNYSVPMAAGMAFNIVADPLVGYFYKTYVLGVPQEAATIWAKMGAVTTLVNAIVAVVVASIFYLALRPALKRANLLPPV